jgi:hypothetical protein
MRDVCVMKRKNALSVYVRCTKANICVFMCVMCGCNDEGRSVLSVKAGMCEKGEKLNKTRRYKSSTLNATQKKSGNPPQK